MKTIKQIHTLLAGALLIAGTALWSGCSNNELLDSIVPGTTASEQAGSISFKLKSPGAQTRASQSATATENEVKTMYAAFFIKNEGEEESAYKLHRIYYYDTESSITNAWGEGTKMTYTEDGEAKSYTVTEDNMKANSTYTGTYVVYFIANPEAAIKAKLKGYQDTGAEARTKLGAFEKELMAEEAAYDATTTATRGFTMVNKSTIEVGESPKKCEVMLTRLAARFDFINSSPANATITSVKFNNLTKKSNLMQSSVNTPDDYFYASNATEVTKTWPKVDSSPAPSMTVYTYENLNAHTVGNTRYSSIDVTYTLGGGQAKTLRVDLKEKETPLALMRNHLYKINLNCISGTYNIAVTDWTGGETVTVPNDKLAIVYTADSLGKVGDYVYNNNGVLAFSDGGLRKMYLDGSLEWAADAKSIKAVTDGSKGKCVGIVFSNNPSAKDRAAGFTHGYAIGLNVAGLNSWCTVAYDTSLANPKTVGEVVSNLDGRTDWNTLKAEKDGNGIPRSFPAFEAVENYNVALPKNCSGWFPPSIGLICRLMDNLAGYDTKSYLTSTATVNVTSKLVYSTNGNIDLINSKLTGSSTSSNDYHLFSVKETDNEMTTTEFNTNNFIYYNIMVYGLTVGAWAVKANDKMVTRPIFAY